MAGKPTPNKAAPALEHLPPGKLIPHARNARTHSEAQIAQIASSIREFGFQAPVVIDADNGILAGHGRVLAALLLGLDEVPCVRASSLTERQRRMYMIADNRLAELAGWDKELLSLELGELSEDGEDIGLVGFTEADLSLMLGEDAADGYDPDGNDGTAELDAYDTVLTLGPYRVPVPRAKFEQWEQAIRATVGFEKDKIGAEMARRIGL